MENQQLAGSGARFVSFLIDAIILGIVGALLGQTAESGALGMVVGAAYYIFFWVKQDGQTLGKKAMHIKVVRTDGKPMDWMTAGLRYIGYIVSGIPLLLGYIWILFDGKKQGWHDKIANTYVVKV
ncbi:RDD family protein [Candidatus Roizmanbacteria bacterium]|nr:MAG: RDD family protein [Candidatus Roizmanbacteria bacterium]